MSVPFKKPNAALVMMPKIGKLTAISRKIFNVLLHETQRQIALHKKDCDLQDVLSFRFQAKLSDVLSFVEAGESNLVTHAKHSLREMRRVELDWEAPDANSEVIFRNMSLLSEVGITKNKGDLYVQWAFPPSLAELIIDPARFTPLDVLVLSKLKTYTAVALYEIISRYKNNPSCVTSEQPLDWWIGALSQSPAPIDPQTKQPKTRNWPKFKDDQLNAAIIEINDKTELDIELKEFKTGRKITSAQFGVLKKKKPDTEVLTKIHADLALAASKADIPLSDISGMLARGDKSHDIHIALIKMESRLTREDLKPIDSKTAYLKSLIQESSRYTTDVEIPLIGKKVETTTKETVALSLNTPELEYKAKEYASNKSELLALPKEQQQKIVEKVVRELELMKLMNPANRRKVAMGDWVSAPFILAKMVDIYTSEK